MNHESHAVTIPRMGSVGFLACGAVLLSVAATPASAIFYYYAGRDWQRFVGQDDPYHAQTLVDGVLAFTDTVIYGTAVTGGAHGGGYAYGDDVGVPAGQIRISTVYGVELNPGNPVMLLTGFNPSNPQLIPLSRETIFSEFNTQYESSDVQVVTLSQLGTVLAGHDLSPFASGDPNSVVYLFQTVGPANEFFTNALCGYGWAHPTQVSVGSTVLLTVTVTAAQFPTSTGIAVTGDLSSIGGSSGQAFYDDGSNGDVTAGDNVFSVSTLVNGGNVPGVQLPFTIQDGQARTSAGLLPMDIISSCGSADFDGDGDFGTDLDIESFFLCLGGACCANCGSADFDGDGDTGTDLDIETFFRVLGGGEC